MPADEIVEVEIAIPEPKKCYFDDEEALIDEKLMKEMFLEHSHIWRSPPHTLKVVKTWEIWFFCPSRFSTSQLKSADQCQPLGSLLFH